MKSIEKSVTFFGSSMIFEGHHVRDFWSALSRTKSCIKTSKVPKIMEKRFFLPKGQP
jgi:hypothetical protein